MLRRWSTWSFNATLAGSFVLLCFSMIVGTGMIVYLASDMQNKINVLQTNYSRSVRLVGQIQAGTDTLQTLVQSAVQSAGDERKASVSSIDFVLANVSSLLKEYRPLVTLPEEEDCFYRYQRAFSEYSGEIRHIISASAAPGDDARAGQLAASEILQYRVRLEDISRKLMAINEMASIGALRDAEQLKHQFELTGVSVIAILLSVSIFIYVYTMRHYDRLMANIGNHERTREELVNTLTARQKKIDQLIIDVNTIEEDQKKRFSRELHDAIGHGLTMAISKVESVLSRSGATAQKEQEDLQSAVGTLKHALRETRRISNELRPPLLDDLGLTNAINQLTVDFERQTGVAVVCSLHTGNAILPPHVETALYRVLQEALTNIERHAKAQAVDIQLLVRENGTLAFSIHDDGCGFTPAVNGVGPAGARGRHLGLLNITERVSMLGGTAMIDSMPGKGTEVNVEIPFTNTGELYQ